MFLILIWLKHLPEVFYQSLRLEACKFIKKETLAQVFSSEFYEIFKSTFFTGQLRATASVMGLTLIHGNMVICKGWKRLCVNL